MKKKQDPVEGCTDDDDLVGGNVAHAHSSSLTARTDVHDNCGIVG